MICSRCETSNAPVARFCSKCGADLHESSAFAGQLETEQEITRRQQGGRSQEETLINQGSNSLLGSTITAKYRIETKIGAGGMGAVYRARRLLIGDDVAIKILHSEQGDPRAAERFRREAQAAARLKHPNAVTIHDFGVTEGGLQYLVMELVEGESLGRIIKQQGPLTPSATADIIRQVCEALDEAHSHNIIHRDIKPDNIIVKVHTNGLRVKVLDFGIAKLRDDAAGNLTQTGSILGTPHYMSPEQCLGEELDSRSDIYSLGVVVYEMLTGVVPFRSPSSGAVIVQHVNQPPPSLRAINAGISIQVESVVLHALEKNRQARPQTPSAFGQELTDAIKAPGLFGQGRVANVSASRGASPPTLLLNPQSSVTGADNPGRYARGSGWATSPARIIGLTVLAMLVLLGLVGVAVRILSSRSSDQTVAASADTNARKDESTLVNPPKVAPAASVTPAHVASPAQLPSVDTSSLRREVMQTLDGWAGAARAHDLDAQMTFYSETVDPYFKRRNVSAAEVRANRSLAFTRYYKLDVQLSNIDIVLDPSGVQATTTFDKTFAFEGDKYFSGSVKSMLWLTKFGSRWLITGEKDLKVYYINK